MEPSQKDSTFNEALYKKILFLMTLDRGYEADFANRYVDQSVFDKLLDKANYDNSGFFGDAIHFKYIKEEIEQQMDKLTAELLEEE